MHLKFCTKRVCVKLLDEIITLLASSCQVDQVRVSHRVISQVLPCQEHICYNHCVKLAIQIPLRLSHFHEQILQLPSYFDSGWSCIHFVICCGKMWSCFSFFLFLTIISCIYIIDSVRQPYPYLGPQIIKNSLYLFSSLRR